MGSGGYAQGGGSGFGPSKLYDSLPYQNYKSVFNGGAGSGWLEEFADALGIEWDVLGAAFVSTAARANLLDPSYTPPHPADPNQATLTQPPSSLPGTATMLDVLCYLVGVPAPIDTNFTVAQKQVLAQLYWAALRRKGTRIQIDSIGSKLSDSVAAGWSTSPSQFSVILPDGAPSPGWGPWVPTSGASASFRPWIFASDRSLLTPITAGWCNLGVGYSQFRAGYSAAGEPVLTTGCRICLLANENLNTWSAGVPTSWALVGNLSQLSQTAASSGSANTEFTGSFAEFVMSSAIAGDVCGIEQTTQVNNQVTHRLELDYSYTNTQQVNTLSVLIQDINDDGTTYYYDATAATWKTSAVLNPVPVGTSATADRRRFAVNFMPQAASSTSTTRGTTNIKATVKTVCDGTATTKVVYSVFRMSLYEIYDTTVESAASGERSLWIPIRDGQGWTTFTRSGSTKLVEPANAQRSVYKAITQTSPTFDYHPALTGRGYRAIAANTNLLKGSNDFGYVGSGGDWDWTNVLGSTTVSSPDLNGQTATQIRHAASSVAAIVSQNNLVADPHSKTYVCGVWAKYVPSALSPYNSQDVTVNLYSGARVVATRTVTLIPGGVNGARTSSAWMWIALPSVTTLNTDTSALKFELTYTTPSGTSPNPDDVAYASAYVYDVTGLGYVQYPAILQTPVGATAAIGNAILKVSTDTVDTNVLHPYLKRTLVSVARGELVMTVVPTFDTGPGDAYTLATGMLFDFGQGSTTNRISLFATAALLKVQAFDNAGNSQLVQLTLTTNSNPPAGSVTWQRDTAISIKLRWADDGSLDLAAGNGSARVGAFNGWTPLDAAVAKCRIGESITNASQFDGLIRDVEVVQIGTPVT